MPVSIHADKLFKRICDIIRDNFANPDFGPCEVAAEAGISLRYLQKLFSAQNSACSHFIHAIRLDHAARLLHRRELLGTRQPSARSPMLAAMPIIQTLLANFAAGLVVLQGPTPRIVVSPGRAPYRLKCAICSRRQQFSEWCTAMTARHSKFRMLSAFSSATSATPRGATTRSLRGARQAGSH